MKCVCECRCRGSLRPLEIFWRETVATISSMAQLQDLRLSVCTTYGRCAVLKKLTALTSLDLAVKCCSDFEQPPGERELQFSLAAAQAQDQLLTTWPMISRCSANHMHGSNTSVGTRVPTTPQTPTAPSTSAMPHHDDAPMAITATSAQNTSGSSTSHPERMDRDASGLNAGTSSSRALASPSGSTSLLTTTQVPRRAAVSNTAAASTHCCLWTAACGPSCTTDERFSEAGSQSSRRTSTATGLNEEGSATALLLSAWPSQQNNLPADVDVHSLWAARQLADVLYQLVNLLRVVLACCATATAEGDLQEGLKVTQLLRHLPCTLSRHCCLCLKITHLSHCL